MDLIKKGSSVFFFPEGTRSKDGKLGAFKVRSFGIIIFLLFADEHEWIWFPIIVLSKALFKKLNFLMPQLIKLVLISSLHLGLFPWIIVKLLKCIVFSCC